MFGLHQVATPGRLLFSSRESGGLFFLVASDDNKESRMVYAVATLVQSGAVARPSPDERRGDQSVYRHSAREAALLFGGGPSELSGPQIQPRVEFQRAARFFTEAIFLWKTAFR